MTTTTNTETWTQVNPTLASKALKCAALAISAWKIGNEEESDAAARRCGALVFASGFDLDNLAKDAAELLHCGNSWGAAVDAYYDAKEAA